MLVGGRVPSFPTTMATDRGYLQEETDWKGGSGTLLVAAPKSKDQQNQTT